MIGMAGAGNIGGCMPRANLGQLNSPVGKNKVLKSGLTNRGTERKWSRPRGIAPRALINQLENTTMPKKIVDADKGLITFRFEDHTDESPSEMVFDIAKAGDLTSRLALHGASQK